VQVKAGQYLSSRSDVLPPAYITSLKLLQDALPPRPLEEVTETVERELGGKVEDLFTTFDQKALATASIAQVTTGFSVCASQAG
jgi:aarF domain-containing kinase